MTQNLYSTLESEYTEVLDCRYTRQLTYDIFIKAYLSYCNISLSVLSHHWPHPQRSIHVPGDCSLSFTVIPRLTLKSFIL